MISVEFTPYATYLCKTCITYMGVASARMFTKNEAMIIFANKLGLLFKRRNILQDINVYRMSEHDNQHKWTLNGPVDGMPAQMTTYPIDVLDDLVDFPNLFCWEYKKNKYWFQFFDGC